MYIGFDGKDNNNNNNNNNNNSFSGVNYYNDNRNYSNLL